ncbi:hypothetical protein [Nocardia colli]|uniref:hypothetical protein n=1 Tax=Nocardia colli TaxID=2545717 RepID=UPI0035D740F5
MKRKIWQRRGGIAEHLTASSIPNRYVELPVDDHGYDNALNIGTNATRALTLSWLQKHLRD